MSKLNWWKTANAVCVLFAATAITAPAEIFTTLASFSGSGSGASLVQGLDGSFYGTTAGGGANGSGTVFRVTPKGSLTTLYSFCSQANCADGSSPYGALLLGSDGNFYGATELGGLSNQGTVFKVTPLGALTTIYSFCSQANCADGAYPQAGLALSGDGNFYGTTLYGGIFHQGTIFRITPQGTLTTLYTFTGGIDGGYPVAALVQGANGYFYGTASGGSGYGTIFSVTPAGVFTVLFNFTGGSGSEPVTPLVQGRNGNLYGTTSRGGDFDVGTVFEMTPWGTLSTLHMFTGGADGLYASGLLQGTDGDFYGTTQGAGVFNNGCGQFGCGTVFKMTPQGRLTTLYDFCEKPGCADGYDPVAGLLQATDGRFYGTTLGGGSDGYGTIFGLYVGLGPFVETVPASGTTGRSVTILGTNLTGSTSVTFNGTAAVFTIVSPTEIATTVPAGATTGTVQVVTSGGTLQSNVEFRVLPQESRE